MSSPFAHTPFYIYPCTCLGCACGGGTSGCHPNVDHVVFSGGIRAIAVDELAVYIAALAKRGELHEMIDRGRRIAG